MDRWGVSFFGFLAGRGLCVLSLDGLLGAFAFSCLFLLWDRSLGWFLRTWEAFGLVRGRCSVICGIWWYVHAVSKFVHRCFICVHCQWNVAGVVGPVRVRDVSTWRRRPDRVYVVTPNEEVLVELHGVNS